MSSNLPEEIGNYRLLEEIGSGTFSIVYRAKHKFLNKHGFVAAKLLKEHPSNEKEQKSFLHEVEILEQLEHPHILPILDAGIEKDTPYIITKLASGESLRDLLLKQTSQLLPLEDTIRILTQVAEALQTAHQQQIVHRDLIPIRVQRDKSLTRYNKVRCPDGICTTERKSVSNPKIFCWMPMEMFYSPTLAWQRSCQRVCT